MARQGWTAKGASSLWRWQPSFWVAASGRCTLWPCWDCNFRSCFTTTRLITLISALVAILMVGLALLLLHFRPRTMQTIVGAGVIVGLGIVVMHYVGMAGMELCRPVYNLTDVVILRQLAFCRSVGSGNLGRLRQPDTAQYPAGHSVLSVLPFSRCILWQQA